MIHRGVVSPSWTPLPPAQGEWSAVRVVGGMIRIRVAGLTDVARVRGLQTEVERAIKSPGPAHLRWIVIADCRRAMPMANEAADLWSRAMRAANASIERSAILVDPANTMFNLQMERIVRCAGSSVRRVFVDGEELVRWLETGHGQGRPLDAQESAELRDFVAPERFKA